MRWGREGGQCTHVVSILIMLGAVLTLLRSLLSQRSMCSVRLCSGGYAIECFICGTRNILQLGMIAAEGEDVLVILCR